MLKTLGDYLISNDGQTSVKEKRKDIKKHINYIITAAKESSPGLKTTKIDREWIHSKD